MSIYGDIERFLIDLYPYRWPIMAGVFALVAGLLWYAYRKGWHRVLWRHWRVTAVIATPALALAGFGGWMFAAPLFINVTVDEEFPFALNAVVPSGMIRGEVEEIMAGMAKVDQEMDEPIPEMLTEVGIASGATEAVPTVGPTPTAEATPTPTPTHTPIPTPTLHLDAPVSTPEPVATPDGTATPSLEPTATPMPTATPTLEPTPTSTPSPTSTLEPTPTSTPTPTLVPQPVAVKLKSGSFRDADPFHKGRGEATVYRGPDGSLLLRLENFRVTNGPDLHVILSPHADPKRPSDVKQGGYMDLGKLKGNIGNQNYFIPDDVDIAALRSVVIYCKPFHIVFSVAPLQEHI